MRMALNNFLSKTFRRFSVNNIYNIMIICWPRGGHDLYTAAACTGADSQSKLLRVFINNNAYSVREY